MRTKLFAFAVALAIVTLLPATLPGGKPPRPAPANPEVTYHYDGLKIYVCDFVGTNKFVLYSGGTFVRSPQMAPDRRSVYFFEAWGNGPERIRRASFQVVSGSIDLTGTETILEAMMSPWQIALSPDGNRLTFANGSLYELTICATPPCDPATDARLLYTPPADHSIALVGGYSANGLAYYFVESSETSSEIRRLDLTGAGPPFAAELVLAVPPQSGWPPRFVQPSPLDHGGLETKLLFGVYDKLYTYETWPGGALVELAGRHAAATWAADDESAIIAVSILRGADWLEGPLDRLDVFGNITASVSKWGGGPDWTPLP